MALKSGHGLTNGEVMEAISRLKSNTHIKNVSVGLVNGAGKGDFISGDSQDAYKKGYTNGVGAGYGQGYTNGLASSDKITVVPLRRDSPKSKRKQVAIAVALVFAIICAPFLTSFIVNDASMVIDGLFEDWNNVRTYYDKIEDVSDKSIDIVEFKRASLGHDVYVYIESAGDMLIGNGSKHDMVVFMADLDGIRNTGYQANGLGYDSMVMASGCYGELISKRSFRYNGFGDDWDSWIPTTQPDIAFKGNQIECKIRTATEQSVIVDAYTVSANRQIDQIDCLLSSQYRGYEISQSASSEIVMSAGYNNLTYFKMKCDANITHISGMVFKQLGTAGDESFGRFSLKDEYNNEIGFGFINDGQISIDTDITLNEGIIENYTLSVNILENTTGNTVLFHIESGYDINSEIVPRVYPIWKNFSYIGYVPTDVRIDGGFSEWDLEYIPDYGSMVDFDRLYIMASDSKYEETTYSMAIRYFGRACAGEIIPMICQNTSGSTNTSGNASGNPTNDTYTIVPEDAITGEDVLYVSIGSDRRVEIRGKDGYITKSVFITYDGQNWTETGSIASYCDEKNVEFSISGVNVQNNDVISIISSNWNNDEHYYNHTHNSAVIEYSTILSDNPINPEPLGNITDMCAHQFNTSRSITIDGVINDFAWGDPYVCQYTVDTTRDFKLITNRDSTYLYVAVFSYMDSTIDNGDRAGIYFDTWDAENNSPNNNSYKGLMIGGSIVYYEGSGSGWSTTTIPTGWSAGRSQTDYLGTNYRTFEFRIPLSDLDSNGNFALDETIGFGVSVRDYKSNNPGAHSYYIWYPDNYYDGLTPTTEYMNRPDTWADLTNHSNFVVKDYVVEAYNTDDAITINGILSESAWNDDASQYIIDNHYSTDCAKVSVMMDDTYLYVGFYIFNDTSKGGADYCQVFFDCDYDQTTSPDTNDKALSISYDNSTTYYEGNGFGWSATTLPAGWAGVSAFTNGNSSFEFRIPLLDLNETGGFWENGDIVGFMLHGYDASGGSQGLGLFYFFPDSTQEDIRHMDYRYNPDQWGEIIIAIPEGNVIIMAFLIFIITAIIWRRKRNGANCGRGNNI